MSPDRPLIRGLLLLRRVLGDDQAVLAGLALVVGAIGAIGAIALRELIALVQSLFFGSGSERLVTVVSELPWWHVLLAPAVGGLLVGLFLRFVMPGGRAENVGQVMTATALRGGRMPLGRGVLAAIANAGSIGVGAPTGREGPAVHLGATLGAVVAGRLRLPANLRRTLLGCGAAAAVAASFNAPIAGVFFALEVVIGGYALSSFAPVVLASVTATVVSRDYYGDFPAFTVPNLPPPDAFLEFPLFALLGVMAAATAMVFMWLTITTESLFARSGIPRPLRPALGGLVFGAIAVPFPHILGVGYEATDLALNESLGIGLLLALIPAKIAATAIALGAGFGGGVFSPSLFIGAMLGGAFGAAITLIAPTLSSGQGAYALVGMGAVTGPVLGAPISTILIVFEMTADYPLTIAVMVAVVVASTITEQVLGKSFFVWQLERRGVTLRRGRDVGLLARQRVRDLMKGDFTIIAPDAPRDAVLERLREARYGVLFVVDADQRLVGVLSLPDVAQPDSPPPETATAASLARPEPPLIEADDTMSRALDVMDRAGDSHLPVISDRDSRKLVGYVHEHDLMLAYHRAILQARPEERS